jgi:hypothetical protein
MADENKGIQLDLGGAKVNFRFTWLTIIIPVLSALGGTAWAGFQLYNSYLSMQKAITNYTAPDLSSYDNRISVLLEKMSSVEKSASSNKESLDYIQGNLQTSINNAVKTADSTDTRVRNSDRDTQVTLRDMQAQIRQFDRETQEHLSSLEKTVDDKLVKLQTTVDTRIKETLANPLSDRAK